MLKNGHLEHQGSGTTILRWVIFYLIVFNTADTETTDSTMRAVV
jgi:hypothetical protein